MERKRLAYRSLLTGVASVSLAAAAFAGIGTTAFVGSAQAESATDPGVRGGAAGAGTPFANLTAGERAFFFGSATPQFNEVEDVPNNGLGPRFNLDSCAGCHAQPATGGSSPATNPEFTRQPTMAPGSTVPPFVTRNGPIREARFIQNPDGTPDGGVHDLFVITGRADTPAACTITQPNFPQQLAANNVIFRIPTPVFGSGLMEAINDTTIRNNLASDPTGNKARFGIFGKVNTNGNDGTVTRFGWKAQNKSLLIFAGEAYNVEMGITNENFPNERDETAACNVAPVPNSTTTFNADGTTDAADIVAFMAFMKFLDQPKAVTSFGNVSSASIANGRNVFVNTGCALCHTPSLTTNPDDATKALSNVQANLFSDLAVHHMGSTLNDGVSQGGAGADEFRTAPLWGVGQRIFFLHDGRTTDLVQAIQAHASPANDCIQTHSSSQFEREPAEVQYNLNSQDNFCGSEANEVVENFNALPVSQKQDLLNFLRSL